jgi:cytochrome oxidase Cu insertion factor (SCO1/SenC/PrrC family)
MNEQIDKKARTRSRIKIVMVAIIFLAPVVAATLWNLFGGPPAKTMNYGELIQPARPLENVEFRTPGGDRVAIDTYKHKWLMVTFGTGVCDKLCEENIYKMRQVHIATGKHHERVKRLLIVTSKVSNNLQKIMKAYPDMSVATGSAKAIQNLADQLRTKDGTALDGLNRIYLIDPLGNFMMTYDSNADPGKMRRDLGRLLRVSHIG